MKNGWITATFTILYGLHANASKIEHIKVYSATMKKTVNTIIIVPESMIKETDFNTIYILHGYSGNPERTIEQDIPGLGLRADKEQTIFVIPDGHFNSWYIDSPIQKDSQYETFIGKELVTYIDQNYQTKKERNHRGLLGWSMGGYGTLLIGTQYSSVFGILGSVCGALDFRVYGKMYQVEQILGVQSDRWNAYAIPERLQFFKSNIQRLIIDCGTDDLLISQNRLFHQLLIANQIPHEYIERPGAHDTEYWCNALNIQLDYFYRFLNEN